MATRTITTHSPALSPGLSESKKAFDWQIEFAAPFLLGLPDDAIAAGSQGQLGLGASYFAANHRERNAGMVFAKQGFIRFKDLGGVKGQSLRLGRMEFIDGTEVAPKDGTLAALKRDRIAHRLVGNFGFSDVGRSFDGGQYGRNFSGVNLTLFGGRPTRGVFQVDGWGELKSNVYYGALTGQVGGNKHAGEWRIFSLGYQDLRDGVLKTDNRPAPVRTSDIGPINIGTFGGHYIHTVDTSAGRFDGLAWLALQTGSWGRLTQRAGAFAVEGGWQPRFLSQLKPWLRGGYNYGSGDKNAGDSTHGTFFQVLPTPRIYARFPFFNMMNNRDVFGEVVLRPAKKVTVRSDLHSLRLANRNDLWYSGGGAFQPWTFGYTGRTSNGQTGLATFYDVSADYNVNAHLSIGTYYGRAAGKSVVQAIYPQGRNANFGFLELLFKL
ncbi:MAG: alginate export family protein [Acidobacteria bacterium]|nr:alginate export family protein [Acidobacteriota bacterium]